MPEKSAFQVPSRREGSTLRRKTPPHTHTEDSPERTLSSCLKPQESSKKTGNERKSRGRTLTTTGQTLLSD